MLIWKKFKFEAAHWLPKVPEGHKCGRLHGHSYQVTVHVEGRIDYLSGWVCDTDEISKAMAPILEDVDHKNLNEIPGLENSTFEILAEWIYKRLSKTLKGVVRVIVEETSTQGCSYP